MTRLRPTTPRIAVAAVGDPTDPALWSGTPSNIVRALREAGADVVTVDVTSPYEKVIIDAVALPLTALGLRHRGLHAGLDRERRAAQQSMTLSRARSRAGSAALQRYRDVDGVVQMGTGYVLSHPNILSYEDMTIAQGLEWPETRWVDVPRRMTQARLRQQAAAYRRHRGAAFSTRWAAQSAITQFGCAPEKVHAVGIGPNFVTGANPDRDWATPRFLFAGREWSRKNGDDVVRAFAEVRRAFPDAELHLAGHHPVIDQPGVIEHGHLDLRDPRDRVEMLHLWGMSTCCVVPSRFEPAGIIYVEAMHAGIPSIGTTNGGAADLIGDAGITVDPRDLDALTNAMLSYCDPAAAATVGERAHLRSADYTWARVASELLEALNLGRGSASTTKECHTT